jgi:putative transposase
MIDNALPTCKLCGSSNVVKFGTYKDEQRYWCKDCQRKFKADDALFGGRVSSKDISSALLEYYSGLSVNDIRRRILQEKGYEPSQSTVYQWVDKFSDKAVKYYAQYQPKVGDAWIADETVVKLDGGINVWVWDVIDTETRFLLASKMSYRRTLDDAVTVFDLAYKRAGKAPKVILTDKLTVYPEAVRRVFGSQTTHERSTPFVKFGEGDSTRRIERWHETLKERTKVMYGLKNPTSALAFLDGFFAYYNFIRPHRGLGDKTPAEVAGIEYGVKSWDAITHLDETQDDGFKPEYAISPRLQEARETITGEPTRFGGRYHRHKGVNQRLILAGQKAYLKEKIRRQKASEIAKKKAEKDARKLAQTMIATPRQKRLK